MPTKNKRAELLRLQKAFEKEANEFPDLKISIFYTPKIQRPLSGRYFESPNHLIMLWQHYGINNGTNDTEQLVRNLATSNLGLVGVRGSEMSCHAVIVGERVRHFIKMAQRAGNIFAKDEISKIQDHAQKGFMNNTKKLTPVFVANRNPVAIWLNYVLFHQDQKHPYHLGEVKINLDPFTASLTAIDQLLDFGSMFSRSSQPRNIEKVVFRVALSFPGEHRDYINNVAIQLRDTLGNDSVFYDNFYQSELARPNLDILLQTIYHKNSDLIVVFLCEDYANKEWCGLEWRALRDLIKKKKIIK